MPARTIRFATIAAFAAWSIAIRSFGQTIPMTPYKITTSRGTFSGKLVGGNPFLVNPSPVTIDAVLVPLIVQILKKDGTVAIFDPLSADASCLDTDSAYNRFVHSPLVVPSELTFNGVDVGNVQYIDGFMRAQFWDVPAPGNPNRTSYFNPLKWSFASSFLLPIVGPQAGAVNLVSGTQCETGVVSQRVLNSYIENFAFPPLQAGGVISPTKFVLFLTKNVSGASNFSPTKQSGFVTGQHFATGNPVQTWAWAQYLHTSLTDNDIEFASHEIGEWMNDPLTNNQTPSWGHVGQVTNKCSTQLEVGDPLNKTPAKTVTTDGYEYHPQEMAFFSWFYNAQKEPSYGADGKFSSKGFFTGPSKDCVSGKAKTGGTF